MKIVWYTTNTNLIFAIKKSNENLERNNRVGKLEIIPLGGIGEFGMNCMAIRYEDEMIVVDAGMGFPEETAYGVDVCIPDFDFLEEYKNDLTALILTHGH